MIGVLSILAIVKVSYGQMKEMGFEENLSSLLIIKNHTFSPRLGSVHSLIQLAGKSLLTILWKLIKP